MYKTLFSTSGLSLDRLRSFCAVAEAGGFNKAAGSKAYKQSQYSRQIAELEKFFDCRLFYREGRTSRLSPNGEKLLTLSKAFLSELELFKTGVSGEKFDLVISTGHSVINFYLSPAINKDLLAMAKSVSFRATSTEESVHDVLSYESHFAIVGQEISNKDLEVIKLLSSPAVMIYSKAHMDKFYIGNDPKKLGANATVLLTGTGSFKKNIISLFKGKHLNVVAEAPYFSALKNYARQGQAVAYIPEYCVTEEDNHHIGRHTFRKLSQITRDLFLVYRKNVVAQNMKLKKITEIFLHQR
jgi:DNA-binding transcriptional LysR family regulator